MSFGAVLFVALIWGVKIFKPEIKKRALRVSLYCTIPPLLYFSTITPSSWVSGQMLMMNTCRFYWVGFFGDCHIEPYPAAEGGLRLIHWISLYLS